ncbi:MAG: CbiX/SirB N-terminal domain-containing protein [Elusimicrobiota bacterium]
MRPSLVSLALLLAAAPAFSADDLVWGSKSYGLVLLGQNGGKDWNDLVAKLRKDLKEQVPLEAVNGMVGPKSLQTAVDRLLAKNVRKIVVVPLFLFTQSDDIEQLQYLLGMRKLPSESFMIRWGMRAELVKRVKAKKVPVVLGHGLDDDPVCAKALLARAKTLSKKPKDESVFLVGQGLGPDGTDDARLHILESFAAEVEKKGGFYSVRALLLRPATPEDPELEQRTLKELRGAIQAGSVRGHVIVLPYLLERDGSERLLKKKLDNLFYRWDGIAMLPNLLMVQWVRDHARELSTLPDQVRFKDDGQPLPPDEIKLKAPASR